MPHSFMTETVSWSPSAGKLLTSRKAAIRDLADRLAPAREKWIRRNSYFYEDDCRYMRFLVPKGLRVLELGCGTGTLLAALKPACGVGVDFSARMIEVARSRYPEYEFHVADIEDPEMLERLGGPFDVIVLSDTIGSLDDCEEALANLHRLCTPDTRVIVAYYNRMWEPVLSLGEILGIKMPQIQQNWLTTEDIGSILSLADFEVVKREWRQLLPYRFFGLGPLLNRFIAPWPVIRRFCLRNYLVARPLRNTTQGPRSATVLVPCRNERGNIEPLARRLPKFCDDIELMFVEGHSVDGTLDEIRRVIAASPDRDIKVLVQDGVGKCDAVRKGFAHARGDVLIILDADLTVPPEALPHFYNALISGKGEFINGTRLVYPVEKGAMRFLNLLANQVFSWLFSWLLNQRFTDAVRYQGIVAQAL